MMGRTLLGVLLLLPRVAGGQALPTEPAASASTQSIGLALGLSRLHMKDDYLCPLVFRGWLAGPVATYRYEGGAVRQEVAVMFSTAMLDVGYDEWSARQYLGSVSYSYLREVGAWEPGGNPLRVFLGGGISSSASNTVMDAETWSPGYTERDQSWYWAHALHAQVEGTYRWGGVRAIEAVLRVPLVRIVRRPENGHWFSRKNVDVINNFLKAGTGGSLEMPWENTVVEWSVEYRQALGGALGFRAAWWFSWSRDEDPQPFRMFRHSLVAGVELGL